MIDHRRKNLSQMLLLLLRGDMQNSISILYDVLPHAQTVRELLQKNLLLLQPHLRAKSSGSVPRIILT